MLIRICLSLGLLVAMPVWSQVEPTATGPSPSSEEAMQTPPSVSGEIYPTMTASEMRSNELRAGLSLVTAYDDNVLETGSTAPVADITYSIMPTIAFDRMTSRLHQTFAYSPSFTLYQRTSARNEADQNASANLLYRLSPHAAVTLRDSFQKSTNVFNQPYGGVSGSTQSATVSIVAPFAEQLRNMASGELSYQFDRNGMIGAGGTSAILNFPNPAQTSGLSNSDSRGASAFYNLRLSSTQYIGVTYRYSRMTASAGNIESETQTHSIYSFYELQLKRTFSLSVSGGPQYSLVAQPPLPASSSWTPSLTASMSWQRSRTNLAASYSRTVSGGEDLLGEFHSNSANANARWRLTRSWTLGCTASYAITKSVSPLSFVSGPGGHTVSGTALAQHPIGERFAAEIGYARLHQSYSGIAVISQYPDSDREYISISYQFRRPLGR